MHWDVVQKCQMMMKYINNFELIVQWIGATVNNKILS